MLPGFCWQWAGHREMLADDVVTRPSEPEAACEPSGDGRFSWPPALQFQSHRSAMRASRTVVVEKQRLATYYQAAGMLTGYGREGRFELALVDPIRGRSYPV